MKFTDYKNYQEEAFTIPVEFGIETVEVVKFKENENAKENLSQFIAESGASSHHINELLEIYSRLVQATDENIRWLSDSNTFQRLWRRMTGKTFKTELQNQQYLNDLNKIGLEILNELNKKMLLQQNQLVWMQDQIHMMVIEQNQFRETLYKIIGSL